MSKGWKKVTGGKRRLAKIKQAADDLHRASSEAFAALWYSEQGCADTKGVEWTYAAISWAERGIATLKALSTDFDKPRTKRRKAKS